jgi:long-chain acyl-CoA synthetase
MVTMDLEVLYPKVAAMLSQTDSLRQIVVCRMPPILPAVKGLLFGIVKRKEIATVAADDTTVRYEDLVNNDGNPKPVDVDIDDDIAVLQYTGGTTGRSKGAMLTQGNLSANISQVLAWFPGLRPGEEKILGVLPLFHVFAMTAVMNFAVASGTEMILLPRYELDQTLKSLSTKKATLFPAVPTIYTAINQAPDLSSYDLSSIRYCMSGGAPLPLEVKRRFEEITGCRLVEGYGLSESSPVATCNSLTGENKENSIGLPAPGTDVSIHDLEPPHDLVAPGERGEVWIKGPQIMKGYLNREQETTDTLRNGWLRTGDVGYMDEQGHFFLVDRLKDLILCSGYNVYPRMVEEAVYLHPSVAEVTVIGIDDDYRGQSPKAFVKLKDGQSLSAEELKTFLEDKISKIEMPSQIEFRDELPKTIIGKLSKKELVAEEQARLSGEKS